MASHTSKDSMASWNVEGMQVLANPPDGSQMHGIAIIYTEWNALVVNSLVNGCVDSLKAANVPENKIYVRKVPSAFELPFAASQMTSKYLEAIICIGAVIQVREAKARPALFVHSSFLF
jgi:6,7-dimethyl-8-ribityllumazine synthase